MMKTIKTDMSRKELMEALEGSIAAAAIGQSAADCLAIASDVLEAIGIHLDLAREQSEAIDDAKDIVDGILDGSGLETADDTEEDEDE